MIDRHTSGSALTIVAIVFVLAAAIVAAGRQPETSIQPTPALSSFIMVLTTPAPPPTADTRELEALRARVAELEAERALVIDHKSDEPQPVYRVMAAPSATPYVADPQLVNSEGGTTMEITVPTDAPRLCDGFGDWRDYSAEYEASPACHK